MELHVLAPPIYEIIRGERDVTPDAALRLALFLGTTVEFWLSLQAHYELEVARDKKERTISQAVRFGPLRPRLLLLPATPKTTPCETHSLGTRDPRSASPGSRHAG